jgi:hypothetical protein
VYTRTCSEFARREEYNVLVSNRPRAVPLATSFTFVKAEFLAAVGNRLVVDALIAFGLVILPMVGMVVMMFLLSGADWSIAALDAADGIGMLIPPP